MPQVPSRNAPVRSIMRRLDAAASSPLACIHLAAIHGSPQRNTASCPRGVRVGVNDRSVSPMRPRWIVLAGRPVRLSDAMVTSSTSGWLMSILISSPAAVVSAPRIPVFIMDCCLCSKLTFIANVAIICGCTKWGCKVKMTSVMNLCEKSGQNIWRVKKKWLPLHRF